MVNRRLICKVFGLVRERFYGWPCSGPRPCCPRIGNEHRLFRCSRDVGCGLPRCRHGRKPSGARAQPRQNIVSTEKPAVSQRKHAIFCELPGACVGYRTDIGSFNFLYEALPARDVLSERFPIPLRESARPIGQDIPVHSKNFGGPLDNKLLSSLPRDQFDLLVPHLKTQSGTDAAVTNDRTMPQRRLTYAALDRMVGEQRRKYVGTNQVIRGPQLRTRYVTSSLTVDEFNVRQPTNDSPWPS
jgi:hypothetical protein